MQDVRKFSWKIGRNSILMKLSWSKLMGIRAAGIGMAAIFLATTGCQLCCPPYLDDYATIGGKWARSHPTQGVVGSAFSDPGVALAGGEEVILQDEFPEATLLEQSIPEPLDDWPSDSESIFHDDDHTGIIILE